MFELMRRIKRAFDMSGDTLKLQQLKEQTQESDGRRIRKAIERLRDGGAPIGSSARRGYFIIRTRQDWEDAMKEFRAKAMACLKMKAQLERIGTALFSGQTKLDFAGKGVNDGSESVSESAP